MNKSIKGNEYQKNKLKIKSIFGFAFARPCIIPLALKASFLWTIVTFVANLVKKSASSIALSPPPTIITRFPRKKNPSHVAHALTSVGVEWSPLADVVEDADQLGRNIGTLVAEHLLLPLTEVRRPDPDRVVDPASRSPWVPWSRKASWLRVCR